MEKDNLGTVSAVIYKDEKVEISGIFEVVDSPPPVKYKFELPKEIDFQGPLDGVVASIDVVHASAYNSEGECLARNIPVRLVCRYF